MRSRAKSGTWAAATLLVLTLAGGQALAKEIKEPESGVGFPETRSWGKYKMICIGTALREKGPFDVYAGCLYVDKELGKQKLLEFLATPAAKGAYKDGKLNTAALLGNEAFYQWLIGADLPISVFMTFVRDVEAEKIRETYDEGLSKYLKDRALITRFTSLSTVEIKKWQQLTLNVFPGGKVVYQYAGKTQPAIVSKPLARALLSIYFGKDPINDKIKRGLVQHVDWLLR